MKIGIITLVSDNYGNKYQNYAVEQLLSKYGEVVTYRVAEVKQPISSLDELSIFQKMTPKHIAEVLRCRMMYQYDIVNTERSVLSSLFYVLTHLKPLKATLAMRREGFSDFQKNFLHISERTIDFLNCHDQVWLDRFDYFVCGSDQIWNPTYTTSSELAFLSFAKGKSIAFAPSFGLSQLPPEVIPNYKEWLNGLSVLSVREEAGRDIIRNLTGRDVPVLLDPTMVLEVPQWEQLCKMPQKPLPPKYILTYFLGRVDSDCRAQIKRISEETKLPVIPLFDIESPEYYVYDPAEVLYAIKNSTLILTDSFHGTVFSILFRRNFRVFKRNEGKRDLLSRLQTLLKKLSLEEFFISESNDFSAPTEETWTAVHNTIAAERLRSLVFLDNAIVKRVENHEI